MTAPPWSATVLLSVVVVCFSFLAWKGIIPVHALFAIGGAIVGWLIPRGASLALAQSRQRSRDSFPQEEIPTKPDVGVVVSEDDPSATRPMLARSIDELRRKK